MNIKYNEDKDNFKMTGMSPHQIELILALLDHVILGRDDVYREAALEMLQGFEASQYYGCNGLEPSPCVVEFVDEFGDGETSIAVYERL